MVTNALGLGSDEIIFSLRDPSGRVFSVDRRIIRSVTGAAVPALTAFLKSSAAKALVQERSLVSTRILTKTETAEWLSKLDSVAAKHCKEGGLLLEHERIPFVSFPYEWCVEMLWAAADLTLRIPERLWPEGFAMKDANTYNVAFRGPDPVFVDLLSFEMRAPQTPNSLPEGEFAEAFLIPLMMNKYYGVPLDRLLFARPKLRPREVYGWCRGPRKLLFPFLQLVSIPAWYGARKRRHQLAAPLQKLVLEPSRREALIRWLIGDLRSKLNGLLPSPKKPEQNQYYSPEELTKKRHFLERTLQDFDPKRVLNIGGSPEWIPVLAAAGRNVVAIDRDPAVVGEFWRIARAKKLNVLPLVVDFCRPTPSMGWRNQERPGFLQRARGAFDILIMLGVVHHVLMHERIPVEEVVDLAAELTNDLLLIEDIDCNEPIFHAISQGRDYLFTALSPENFRKQFLRKFFLSSSEELPSSNRRLYVFRKR